MKEYLIKREREREIWNVIFGIILDFVCERIFERERERIFLLPFKRKKK